MARPHPAPTIQTCECTDARSPVPFRPVLRGALHAHYVRAILLLAECQPYVDDPDLFASVDELMADVGRGGSLTCRRDATQWEVALPAGSVR